ncbi:hypothetical protein CYLTODRAFT_414874 [Cylindrobasidium torrendii FP15055 ss-10]|uniref:Uncharacterized protein n=1 Tax=Cylindrobasidium torrendii FP15055 ss-10 TaxID=1314674 RepID=A0A0D7AVL2_9AGAR|nr:hypothetical protein CYLTODRAFT_414874 [Cylindrobasidium torrendii FP15055 ss-10]
MTGPATGCQRWESLAVEKRLACLRLFLQVVPVERWSGREPFALDIANGGIVDLSKQVSGDGVVPIVLEEFVAHVVPGRAKYKRKKLKSKSGLARPPDIRPPDIPPNGMPGVHALDGQEPGNLDHMIGYNERIQSLASRIAPIHTGPSVVTVPTTFVAPLRTTYLDQRPVTWGRRPDRQLDTHRINPVDQKYLNLKGWKLYEVPR